MVTFKIMIRGTVRKDGYTNVKIRVTHKRQSGYLSTDIYVLPEEMEDERINSLYRNADDAHEINMKMLGIKGSYAVRVGKIKEKVRHYSLRELLNYLKDERDSTDLFVILDNKIKKYKEVGNVNYMVTFKTTRSALLKYLGYELLPLEIISHDWLSRFEFNLKKEGNSINTIGVYMRNIRTCFNDSITLGLVDYSLYPFRRYKIPKGKTRKRNLSHEEMSKIVNKEFNNKLTTWARDMYMLSFYLIGINIKDMMFINKVDEERVFYVRSKGKKDYSIKVFPEAQEIIDRYKGKTYMLDAMDKYTDYRTALRRINLRLKDVIAVECGIDKPLTTYYARHTWATIASSLGVSRDTIRYALGHATSTVTDIYIDYDLDKVDQANRMVIDYIKKLPSESAPLSEISE